MTIHDLHICLCIYIYKLLLLLIIIVIIILISIYLNLYLYLYDTLWQFVTVCEVEIDLSKPGSQHFVTQDHFLNLPRWSGVAAVMSWLHPAKSETRKQRMGPACVVLVGQDADHDV